MKIEKSYGCTVSDLKFDGKSEANLSNEERGEVVKNILEKLKEHLDKNYTSLWDVVELFQYDSYESDKDPCDQCGDTISKTTWNI